MRPLEEGCLLAGHLTSRLIFKNLEPGAVRFPGGELRGRHSSSKSLLLPLRGARQAPGPPERRVPSTERPVARAEAGADPRP